MLGIRNLHDPSLEIDGQSSSAGVPIVDDLGEGPRLKQIKDTASQLDHPRVAMTEVEMALGGKERIHVGTAYLVLPPSALSEHIDILCGVLDELVWKRMRMT